MSRNKNTAYITLAVFMLLAFIAAVLGLLFVPQADAAAESARFIFAGTHDDADCAILISRGTCLVIDTGEEQDGEHILALLEENDVERVDCLILTHPDKDHIGGASLLLDSLPVGKAVMPSYTQTNVRYEKLLAKMKVLGVETVTLTRTMSFELGDFKVDIYPPKNGEYKGENNNSLVTYVRHGRVSALFMGDAKKKRLSELNPSSFMQPDIYKVPHHGRSSAASVQWIQTLRPKYAVVTAAAPEEETATALEQAGSTVLCTRPMHDVVFISSGSEVTLDSAA